MFPPFRRLTTWYEQNPSAGLPQYGEFLDAVVYHLDHATRAADLAGDRARDCQAIREGTKVYVLSHHRNGIAEYGDTAVRAATSALELGLQLTSHVLTLGVRKADVSFWNGRKAKNSVRHALVALP